MASRPVAAGGPLGMLHVHSDYSHDGRDSLEALRECALARGVAFVSVTDHAEDLDAAAFARLTAGCARLSDDLVTLVPGLEFRFRGFNGLHLLACGLTRWIEPESPAAFVEATRGVAGFTILAHPRLAKYHVPDEVRAGIDAVEVWNAGHDTRYLPDPGAIELLYEMRVTRPEIVGTAGLDQHDCRNDRETRVRLHHPAADPLAELRAGRFTNIGRTMHFDATVGWGRFRLGTLGLVRRIFDRVERTQDRLARGLAARGGR